KCGCGPRERPRGARAPRPQTDARADAGTLKPPNLCRRLLGGQCVQHCQARSGADAGADKDHGTLALLQRKAAAGSAYLEDIARLNERIDVLAGGAIWLTLDNDAIAILARLARQRIAAQEGRPIGCRLEPQNDK